MGTHFHSPYVSEVAQEWENTKLSDAAKHLRMETIIENTIFEELAYYPRIRL